MFLHLGYVLMTNFFMIFFLQLFHYFGRLSYFDFVYGIAACLTNHNKQASNA